MRERAAAAGGALTVRSGPAGTQVRMTVPIKPGPVKPGRVKAGPVKAGPVKAGHVKAGGER
jgi:hypothetical protein